MSPVEYAEEIVCSGFEKSAIVSEVLSKDSIERVSVFLGAGYRVIADRVGERYPRMSPEAVKMFTLLESFLVIFAEHVTNWDLIDGVMKKAIHDGCDCQGAC